MLDQITCEIIAEIVQGLQGGLIVRSDSRIAAPIAGIEVRFDNPSLVEVLRSRDVIATFEGQAADEFLFTMGAAIASAGIKMPKLGTTLDQRQLDELNGGHCPSCGGTILYGPRGGMSQNVACQTCRQEYCVGWFQEYMVLGHRAEQASEERMKLFSPRGGSHGG